MVGLHQMDQRRIWYTGESLSLGGLDSLTFAQYCLVDSFYNFIWSNKENLSNVNEKLQGGPSLQPYVFIWTEEKVIVLPHNFPSV